MVEWVNSETSLQRYAQKTHYGISEVPVMVFGAYLAKYASELSNSTIFGFSVQNYIKKRPKTKINFFGVFRIFWKKTWPDSKKVKISENFSTWILILFLMYFFPLNLKIVEWINSETSLRRYAQKTHYGIYSEIPVMVF